MPKSHKPKTTKPVHAKGTPGVQVHEQDRLRTVFAQAAGETVPEEILQVMDAAGDDAYAFVRGMLVGLWDAIRRSGEMQLLSSVGRAVREHMGEAFRG